MCGNACDIVQVRSKVNKRFYEAVILLASLSMACVADQPSKTPDLSSELSLSPEHAFHCFVNKLGQLCDSQPGGNTVTSCVVLDLPDHIEYRFASNQQDIEDLIRAKTFIKCVLQAVGKLDEDKTQATISSILQKCLSFNRLRIEGYVTKLKKHSIFCIRACTKEDKDECEYEAQITPRTSNKYF
jgi:hypothetical protein